MNIKQVTPEQAHELAMLAATQVGAAPAAKIAAAYVAAYEAIVSTQTGEQIGRLIPCDRYMVPLSDPSHPDYFVKNADR